MANEIARSLRKRMTRQEVKLWLRLRDLQRLGYHFRRQSPIHAYVVDFECRRSRLVIEVDGGQHGFDGHLKQDTARDRYLQSAGYRVLRFWNNQIDRELDGVIETILSVLSERRTPPGSSRDKLGPSHPPLMGRDEAKPGR